MEAARTENTTLLLTVRSYLKEYIISHDLGAGDPLPTEKELSAALNLSRTAVREALKGLQELGIAESIQGKGHFLREFNFDAALTGFDYLLKPSLQSFRDLLEIRMYMESVFLARDVFLFTDEDFRDLENLLDEMEQTLGRKGEVDGLINLHSRFHQTLYRHSGNMLLLELINMFSVLQHKLVDVHGYHSPDTGEFMEEHRKILESLERREPEMVRSALIDHFSEPLTWVREKMGAAKKDRAGKTTGGTA